MEKQNENLSDHRRFGSLEPMNEEFTCEKAIEVIEKLANREYLQQELDYGLIAETMLHTAICHSCAKKFVELTKDLDLDGESSGELS